MIVSSLAVTSEVMAPIRPSGEEIGLIFVPGAQIKGEAYRKTARAIQDASAERVWVALTGNYTASTPNPLEIKGAVLGAIDALKAAGMKSTNYVGVAHSLGGVFLAPYAEDSPLKAVVLLGAYLNRSTKLADYPKPVLTLSGELDGQTRITRIAVDYEQLMQVAEKNSTSIFRTPVINIKGSCHAQFASGPMPPEVKKYDLTPAISDLEAHAFIGRYVSSFLAVTFSKVPEMKEEAQRDLNFYFKESGKRFLPLLGVKALDVKGTVSPWAQICQAQLAGKFVARTTINNKILQGFSFLESKPSIEKLGMGAIINTTSLVEYEKNPLDVSLNKESPKEIDVKMKSKDAIKKVLNVTLPEFLQAIEVLKLDKEKNITCKDLNQLAYQLALKNSTTEAQERYRRHGRLITFKDDLVYGTGFQWASQPLVIEESDKGLTVQGVALVTSMSSTFFPGMHYCKVLSPYRAMEWINVDSLRDHAPNRFHSS
ncbi:hypothetical protein ElyMa_003055700 [Elysia marginata]|uniref:Alpha/beta hydrolase fold-5 domain-containing protein n=1 Tax=Elysia marginata TaxID=1093978 RepID=A0AAV4INZ2_9GAST|nr:hypothetical protein ElyMa_003055700 [Elysia marginata]